MAEDPTYRELTEKAVRLGRHGITQYVKPGSLRWDTEDPTADLLLYLERAKAPVPSPEPYQFDHFHTAAQIADMTTWLGRLTYRPGAVLTIGNRMGQTVLEMTIPVFNSYGQMPEIDWNRKFLAPGNEYGEAFRTYLGAMLGDIIKVSTSWVVPPYVGSTQSDFIVWVRRCMHEWETHEADEWLKDKATGKPIFDPHANGRTQL